jgi:hypothetical protein
LAIIALWLLVQCSTVHAIKVIKPPIPTFSILLQIYKMNSYLFQKMSSSVKKGVRPFQQRLSLQRISEPKPQLAAVCRSLSTFTTTRELSIRPTALNNTSLRFKSTAPATATAAYDLSVDSFPSIVIGADRAISPQGSFAEAQAQVGYFISRCSKVESIKTNLYRL